MSPLAEAAATAVGIAAMVSVPGYVILQIWAPIRVGEGWRKAALAPLVLAIPLVVWCAYAFADQSNLWPVPFILFAPPGAAYLALILLIGRRKAAA